MSKIDRMITFVEVIDSASFRAAAKKLKISTAAVSKQISTLENELGAELIKRTTRTLMLTDTGQAVYEQCKRLIKEIYELEALASDIQKEPSGKVKVVSANYFARLFIIPYLKEFYERYPKLTLDLALEERIPDFEKEGVDILIGMSMSGPMDSIQRKIATTCYVLCATPQYLKLHGVPKKLEDLKKHNYITHSIRRPNDVIVFADNKQVQVKPILYVNDTKAMVDAALQDLGIINVHEYAVRDALAKKELVELLPSFSKRTTPIYVCYRQSLKLPSKIRVFIDFVLEKMAKTLLPFSHNNS
jgi:DNA-binding transcriptional LysR family regulator